MDLRQPHTSTNSSIMTKSSDIEKLPGGELNSVSFEVQDSTHEGVREGANDLTLLVKRKQPTSQAAVIPICLKSQNVVNNIKRKAGIDGERTEISTVESKKPRNEQ